MQELQQSSEFYLLGGVPWCKRWFRGMRMRYLFLRRVVVQPRFVIRLFSNESWTCNRVRDTFIQYFTEKHGHIHYPSSPVVPVNDPTLLFANAGMNQFKPIILGTVERSSALASLQRAVNSQKCIRAGGKHNDLDDVGKDTYHHTFFEMLGTWSFDDYFKRECIAWAFDLLINVYRLPKDRLYVTYFAGDAEQGLEADTEARDLWLQLLPPERVLPFGKAANFWEMGESGPCGPCSEIHFDRIGGRDAASLVNRDDPNVVEIWNLVFMQYNRDASSGLLSRLPAQHIDTGMGLERLVSILQNATSNYDTDVFASILSAISRVTGCRPYSGRVGASDEKHVDMAYRVLADHCRTLVIAIADGAIPSNEGRGYVLRRILRRAIRFGSQTLSAPPNFFAPLVGEVIDILSPSFPEITGKRNIILEIVEEEEKAFSALLHRGISYFDRLRHLCSEKNSDLISGADAFHLYDTLGFPLDLSQIMAAEAGLRVDVEGFKAAMEEQKDRSRRDLAEKKLQGRVAVKLEPQDIAVLVQEGCHPTCDAFKYSHMSLNQVAISGIVLSSGLCHAKEVALGRNSVVGLVLDKSCFYSEGGGQISDTGTIKVQRNSADIEVIHAASFGDYVLHTCVVQESTVIRRGDMCSLTIDVSRRRGAAKNHTITHVLNSALRAVLGEEVDQRGSYVGDDKLRFDFNHNKSLTPNELLQLERYVNNAIASKAMVRAELVPLSTAMAIPGVRAVFGDVYPDPVRVVTVLDENENIISVELCGGTHLTSVEEAEAFVIVDESSVSKGVRRVTAVTGTAAVLAQRRAVELSDELHILTSRYNNIIQSEMLGGLSEISELQREVNHLKKNIIDSVVSASYQKRTVQELEMMGKQLSSLKKKLAKQACHAEIEMKMTEVDALIADGKSAFGLHANLGDDMKMIKMLTDALAARHPHASYIIFSTDAEKNKVVCFAYVSKEAASSGLHAVTWLQTAVSYVGGKCGGKENSALGTIDDSALVNEAIKACNIYIQSI